MHKFIIGILALFFLTNAAYAEKLKFVQVTDIHLSLDGTNRGGRLLESSVQSLELAVKSVNEIKDLNFVAFSGDNIDTAHEDNLRTFCEIAQNLNKPYYMEIGDHDVFKFGGFGKDDYFKVVRQYNKNQKSNNPNYYIFPNNEFIVIFMDGALQYIPGPHGRYTEGTVIWLDNLLKKYKNKKAIIIQHFPLVEPTVNPSHRLMDADQYWNVLKKHKNVIAILSGHFHYGSGKITIKDNVYHISSPALVEAPHQYRIVEIDYDPKTLFNENSQFNLKTELIPVGQ